MSKTLITGCGPNSFLGKAVLKEISNYQQFDILAPSSLELDLMNNYATAKYFYENKINKIVHLAAHCGGILKNINEPFTMCFNNIKMMVNIFEAIKMNKIEYLISLGTTCSYPKFGAIPLKENEMWNGPSESSNTPYSESKRMLITMTQAYKKQYGFKALSLVPANLFGPFDHFSLRDSHVVPALIRKFYEAKLNNESNVKLWGSGSATREFLYVENCAQAIVKCLVNEVDSGLPINIGVGQDISIFDLANLIAFLIDYDGEILFTGEVSDGQPKRMLDVSRAKELIGFEATTSLRDGLIKTIEWYKDNREEILNKG